ncbi:MAG: glycosyltransferase [Bacteroidales bacterium]|nr:glycosyltransferase [Bacteroidales bacterium]
MRLSVIMPVYNAQNTLERTLRSISSQLSRDVELVIVDDGSTDSTPDILSRFADENPAACQVIRQENAGAAAARNAAINNASGDYLAFIDADDRVPDNALERILKATENNSDIIGWDWQNECNGQVRRFRQAEYSTPEDAIKNLMGGTMKWNLWLFTVKHSLVNQNSIRFLEGADMGEDMAFMLKCFACSKTVKQVHDVLYEYNASNPTSISRQLSERRRTEVSANLQSAHEFLKNSAHSELCDSYLPHLKLYIKLPLLISACKEDYRTWFNWFPEANSFAFNNKELPLRTRALQWMASKRMWGAVRLYAALYSFITKHMV